MYRKKNLTSSDVANRLSRRGQKKTGRARTLPLSRRRRLWRNAAARITDLYPLNLTARRAPES